MWDLAEKKVVRSRDIAFMEEKTIVDWETEKKGSSSESTIIARNRDTSKPIAVHSKPKLTKLRERIRRVADMTRSITSALQPKFCQATRTYYPLRTQWN